jgi:rubrerythrin
MLLTEKEMSVLKDLQTQEKNCIDKYEKYAGLKQLFEELKKKEQEHYKTIGQMLNGEVPSCDCNDTAGKDYQPKGNYSKSEDSEDKKNDCFLATDSIGTEKLVSGEYNTNVFACSLTSIRKALADIEIEEQNHAEMLYKYKMANGMQ